MKKIILMASLAVATMSLAKQTDLDHTELREPPREEVLVCVGKNEGDSCTIPTPNGDLDKSTCQKTPNGKYFVCKPESRRTR